MTKTKSLSIAPKAEEFLEWIDACCYAGNAPLQSRKARTEMKAFILSFLHLNPEASFSDFFEYWEKSVEGGNA